jgi:predicted nucleic acid-binding protein
MDPRRPPVTLVLDASVTLAWIFERQDPNEAKHAQVILTHLDERPALVPPLWHTEVLNALLVAHRRGIATLSTATDFLTKLAGLPIETDGTPVSLRSEHVFALAREYGLSAYDATYLDLALRTGAALVTFDRRLAQARDAAGASAF